MRATIVIQMEGIVSHRMWGMQAVISFANTAVLLCVGNRSRFGTKRQVLKRPICVGERQMKVKFSLFPDFMKTLKSQKCCNNQSIKVPEQ
jgi:hypothetical protein